MLVAFEDILDGRSSRAVDRNKAKILAAICGDRPVTRKRLASRLRIRPTTISALVNELIDDGVVVESKSLSPPRQGRPEILLQAQMTRFAVLVIHVVSHDIRGALVDMAGNVLAERVAGLNGMETGNKRVIKAIEGLIDDLRDEAPAESQLLGIGIAVPGIIDPAERRWIFSSRWPKMRDLSFDAIAERTGLTVHVSRNLSLELRTRMLRRPEERKGGVLFVHWGYGIGSAYSWNGTVLDSSVGSFGELGHWIVSPDSRQTCFCGETGCLETEAALWAMLPEIRRAFPDAPADEWAFERFMREHRVTELEVMRRAGETFALSLANLYKAFYPERVVLTGPFALQERIFDRLNRTFERHLPFYARDKCQMYAARPGPMDVIHGSSLPFFQKALRDLLISHG